MEKKFLFLLYLVVALGPSIPKKKLVPQVEIPGSYGQLQNHNLETSCCGQGTCWNSCLWLVEVRWW